MTAGPPRRAGGGRRSPPAAPAHATRLVAVAPAAVSRAGLVLAGLVLAGLVLGGCRQPDRLDMARASRRIADSLESTYDRTVDQVRCPRRVAVRAGATFDCDVRIGGLPLTVEVTQRTGDGDLEVAPTAAVVVTADVRAELKRTIGAQLDKTGLRAGCGAAPLRIVEPGGTFQCRVADRTTSRVVTVEVRDAAGNLTFTLQ